MPTNPFTGTLGRLGRLPQSMKTINATGGNPLQLAAARAGFGDRALSSAVDDVSKLHNTYTAATGAARSLASSLPVVRNFVSPPLTTPQAGSGDLVEQLKHWAGRGWGALQGVARGSTPQQFGEFRGGIPGVPQIAGAAGPFGLLALGGLYHGLQGEDVIGQLRGVKPKVDPRWW